MMQATPPRSNESLPTVRPGVNALPPLAGAQIAVAGVAAAVALVAGLDDADEILGAWIVLSSSLGVAQAFGLAWLLARLDRRLAEATPAARGLWLLVAFPVTATTLWAPMLLLTPVQAVTWAASGRSRHAEGAIAGLAAWVVVALALPLAGLALRALKRETRTVASKLRPTDRVPTGWVGVVWALPLAALPAFGVVLGLEASGLVGGLALLVAWALLGALGPWLLGRWLAPLREVPVEAMGLAWVALGLPLFALGLVPSWGDHEDAHWAALAAACLVTWVGVAVAVDRRGLRTESVRGIP